MSLLLNVRAIRALQPRTQVMDEYREDMWNVLEVWEREIECIYRRYGVPRVKASEYERIDGSERR